MPLDNLNSMRRRNSENEKENIYKLPNFDKEIFEEIMMIKIN